MRGASAKAYWNYVEREETKLRYSAYGAGSEGVAALLMNLLVHFLHLAFITIFRSSILKSSTLIKKCHVHLTRGAVTLLGHNELGRAVFLVLGVDRIPVEEDDDVGVLLNSAYSLRSASVGRLSWRISTPRLS